jgi:hypothetical protein
MILAFHAGEEVDVAGKVSWCVDNVEAPVAEDVQDWRRCIDNLPWSL